MSSISLILNIAKITSYSAFRGKLTPHQDAWSLSTQ